VCVGFWAASGEFRIFVSSSSSSTPRSVANVP
jgi:hypothetical protein